jgi:uncharacterized protein YeaO (DUF488 family)
MKQPVNTTPASEAPSGRQGEASRLPSAHEDWLLDEALQETFPASDPIAPAGHPPGGSDERHDPVARAQRIARGLSDAPQERQHGALPTSTDLSEPKGPARGDVRLKRAYEPAAAADGVRLLVDRLWPRGLRKASAAIDFWAKDLAPSTELRQWFGHDPERWQEFRRRYTLELHRNAARVAEVRELMRKGPVTLVYAARDEVHNDAVVLREVLLGRLAA